MSVIGNNQEKRENFVIVDANAFVHSCFHGYSPCLDAKKEDHRVLYGIMNSLVDLTFQLPQIDYLYVIFDPPDGSLYRKSIYPAYKANRPPTDPDLARQKIVAMKVLEDHLGIPTLTYPGYEADDIIGTLAKLAAKEYNVIVVSPDKDLAQLVDDNVILLRKIKTRYERGYKALNTSKVYENFGVYPNQIPDWLALVGDKADNLPGLEKVGDKTAASLLNMYPSIEHMFAMLHQFDNQKIKIQMEEKRDTIILVKKLATIICDLPLMTLAEEAIVKADKIRTHHRYHEKLLLIKKHYDWPEHFISLFK